MKTLNIDYLALTFKGDKYKTVMDVIDFLGLTYEDFDLCDRGLNGYGSRLLLNGECNCMILFNGREDMGTHLRITGSAITDVIKGYYIHHHGGNDCPFGVVEDCDWQEALMDFMKDIRDCAYCTRIDLCCDEREDITYQPSELVEYCRLDLMRTKWSTNDLIEKRNKNGVIGSTAYFGSRVSDCFLRVYDKRLEQWTKTGNDPKTPWVRWEFEIKRDYANRVINYICNEGSIARVFYGLASNYIAFVDATQYPDVEARWAEFLEDIEECVKLYVAPVAPTLDSKRAWFLKQVCATFATLLVCEGKELDYVADNVFNWLQKAYSTTSCKRIIERVRGKGWFENMSQAVEDGMDIVGVLGYEF